MSLNRVIEIKNSLTPQQNDMSGLQVNLLKKLVADLLLGAISNTPKYFLHLDQIFCIKQFISVTSAQLILGWTLQTVNVLKGNTKNNNFLYEENQVSGNILQMSIVLYIVEGSKIFVLSSNYKTLHFNYSYQQAGLYMYHSMPALLSKVSDGTTCRISNNNLSGGIKAANSIN